MHNADISLCVATSDRCRCDREHQYSTVNLLNMRIKHETVIKSNDQKWYTKDLLTLNL